MATSNITIVGLSAVGGVSQVVLNWAVNDPNIEGLSYLRYDHAEIWASTSADMSGATKIGVAYTAFADLPVARGLTKYYQVRAVDRSGLLGAFTATANGKEISGVVLIGDNGYWEHPSGLILQWGIVTSDATGVALINFPIAFPNRCFQVIPAAKNNTTSVAITAAPWLLNAGSATLRCTYVYMSGGVATIGPIAGDISYLAIGY